MVGSRKVRDGLIFSWNPNSDIEQLWLTDSWSGEDVVFFHCCVAFLFVLAAKKVNTQFGVCERHKMPLVYVKA